ncbi:sperm-associated microtubule inner protein 4 [Notamacropus eugenii]|uniref:sperm-associated microtubule inner protein 4 n=1 Tax=Notamacropus eugenii TaxID=9315 RepID=UPI003B672A87
MEVCRDLSYYYRQLEGTDILSNTIASNEIHTPLQIPARATASEDRYQEFRKSNQVHSIPWGREREYGALLPISLPEEHRPKSEPPRLFSKGHKHYGFGGAPCPRGIPMRQFYHLTQNRKSNLYDNDSLIPKPLSTKIEPLCVGFPVGHPYQTHISRCAMFPSFTSPKDMNSGLAASTHQPFPATIPTGPYETTVLKKTKGNPYRHESLVFPSDSQKKALHWPGQSVYYNLPKHIENKKQIFYPKPPKLLAPNTTLTTLDPLCSLKEANIQRNLERSHWITSYTHDFTGLGPMNPLELDDFHEKEIATLTGQIGFDSPLQEHSHPAFLPTRPLEGRIARILQGRRPQDSVVIPQRLPLCPKCTPRVLCTVHSVVPSQAEMMLIKGSTPAGPVAPKNKIFEIEEIIRDRLIPPSPYAFPPDYNTKENMYNFYKIYEPNPYPKITDTYRNDALYWRQLSIRPTYQTCVKPEDLLYYDNMKPSQLDQYIVWHDPVSLNKPSVLPELADQKPPFSPCHHFINEPQDNMKPSQLDEYIVWPEPVSLSKPSILPDLVDQKPPFSPCHRFINEPHDNMKPSRLDQYIVWRDPVSLSKPNVLPELANQKPLFSPCHRFINEPQEYPQIPDAESQEEKDFLLKWIPNAGVAQPQTCLQELQDSFSKTDAQRCFQESIVEDHKDLRDNERLGKRHNFYNYNAYYFFN